MMIYNNILCLGDSITYGSRDEYGRAWPYELSDLFYQQYNQTWVSIVRAVPGLTSSGLMRNLFDWINGLTGIYKVVVLIGTNDTRLKVMTPSKVFRKNLEFIIRTLSVMLSEASILLCTLPDLGRFGSPDYSRRDSQILLNKFNKIIIEIADKEKLLLVKLDKMPIECYADTVHFNNKGSVEIAKRIVKRIETEF